MKKSIKYILILLNILNASSSIVPNIEPIEEEGESTWHVIKIEKDNVLNIHTGASIKNKKIGEFSYATENILIDKCEYNKKDKLWCKLGKPFDNREAWVLGEYISNEIDFYSNQEYKYDNLKFLIKNNNTVSTRMGRGKEYDILKVYPYKNIEIRTCMKGKDKNEWCWSDFNNTYGWIKKDTLEPIIDTCSNAIQINTDKDKIFRLCSEEAYRLKEKKDYRTALHAYFFAYNFQEMIKLYESKQLIGVGRDSYLRVSFAYKKLGDIVKSKKVLNNTCDWHTIEDIENILEFTYLDLYPEDKKETIKCDLGREIEVLEPMKIVVPKVLKSNEESKGNQSSINRCLNFIDKNKKITTKELYNNCYEAIEELQHYNRGRLSLYLWSSHNILEKYNIIGDRLATIAMMIDSVEPEKEIFKSYISKDNLYYSPLYTFWLKGQYKYMYNMRSKKFFFKSLFKAIFEYVPNATDSKDRILQQLKFLKILNEKVSDNKEGINEYIGEINKLQQLYQSYVSMLMCFYTDIKKVNTNRVIKIINPIFLNKNNKISTYKILEKHIFPVLFKYIYVRKYYDNSKDNIKRDGKPNTIRALTSAIDDVNKYASNNDISAQVFIKYIDKKDFIDTIKYYINMIDNEEFRTIYKKYKDKEIIPLISKNKPILNQSLIDNLQMIDPSKVMLASCMLTDDINKKNSCIKNILSYKKDSNEYDLLASGYIGLGEYESALDYINKELQEKEKKYDKLDLNLAKIYYKISYIYYKLENYNKSLEYLKKSLNIFSLYSQSLRYCNATKLLYLLNEKIHINSNYLNKQKNIFLECKKYNKISDKDREKIEIEIEFASIFNKVRSDCFDFDNLMEQKEVAKNKKKILEASIMLNGENSFETAIGYLEYAIFLLNIGNIEQAYVNIDKSFDIILYIKNIRFTYMSYQNKIDYMVDTKSILDIFLNVSYLNSKKDKNISIKTLNAWLNYKGSIFDSENAITTLYETTKDSKLKEQIDTLRMKQRYYAKLQQSASKEKNYKEKIKTTTEEIEELTQDIASKAQSFREAEGLKDINYQDISSTLADKQLYIDYAKAGENYYIFTLDKKENITFTQIDSNDTKEIDRLVELFRADIQTMLKGLGKLTPQKLQALNQNSKETLGKLHTLLITKPLSEIIKEKNNLLISPDGALRLLPFEALYDSTTQKYLLEESDIEYIPSGKERVRLIRYNSTTNDTNCNSKLVLFTDPHYDDTTKAKLAQWQKRSTEENQSIYNNELESALYGLPLFDRLRGTRKEARFISELFGAEHIISYRARKSSEENLLKTKHPKILHLSTHGFFLNNPKILNPMLKSGLVFAGANIARTKYDNTDGLVTALKLSGLELKATDLVVLSACQTGVVDSNSTESVSGLSKAFIQAGAKSVLSTLWSVANKESTTLIEDFYKQIADKESYSVALKRAKLKMITQGKHPFFWGGFVLVGE